MKIALVHDWLTGMRGGERVLEAFLALYPDADVLALVHVPGSVTAEIESRVRQVSWLSRLPGIKRYYRTLLPFFPSAARSLDLSGYDLVISLSHAAAKNVIVKNKTGLPNARHVCYCFTPMRYIWDQVESYLGKARFFFWPFISALRRWDVRGAKRVDNFVAISKFVAARIKLFYGQQATVVYPPAQVHRIMSASSPVVFPAHRPFIYAGALVPYKRADLVVAAFNQLGLPLVIVGCGSEEKKLRRMALDNVRFISSISDRDMVGMLRTCRALVFPGVEDFGLIPVEAMACGRPVIANSRGGVGESVVGARIGEPVVRSKHTGVFIPRDANDGTSEVENLVAAVRFFVQNEESFSSATCKERAQMFDERSFERSWRDFCVSIGIPSRSLGVTAINSSINSSINSVNNSVINSGTNKKSPNQKNVRVTQAEFRS